MYKNLDKGKTINILIFEDYQLHIRYIYQCFRILRRFRYNIDDKLYIT